MYLVVVGVWGTTWIAIKASVASVPPITASGLRFAIAFPLLALIVARPASRSATPGAAGACSRWSPSPTSPAPMR